MERTKKLKITLRILLTVLTGALIAWIFSNSLKVATESAAQSGGFVQKVQAFFKWLAPNSFIATAEGEDLRRLENAIRVLAHFAEFALLGAMCFWTYRAYTAKKIWMIMPFVASALVAVTDEILQYFTPGRAFEWTDVATDTTGCFAGCLFALATVAIGRAIYRKIKAKKAEKREQENG